MNIYIYIYATALARLACQGCVFRVCVILVCFVCCFSMFVLSACLLSVSSNSVGIAPPLHHRGNDVCPLWVSYFSIVFCMYCRYFVIDVGFLLDSMFAPVSIIVASFSHQVVINLGMVVGFIFYVFVDTFFRSRTQPANPFKKHCLNNEFACSHISKKHDS